MASRHLTQEHKLLLIIENGPIGRPKGIDHLMEMLSKHPLDPRLHDIGFWGAARCALEDVEKGTYVDGPPIHPDAPEAIRFSGNFMDVSSGFCVDTDNPELIETLRTAIEANQTGPMYQAGLKQHRERVGWWAERNRLRMSTATKYAV